MDEDLLNPNMHDLKDALLLNTLENIISQPTRQLALLDPIILHEDTSPLNQGIQEGTVNEASLFRIC